ncbi:hypothetical protein [Actinomadura sp. B10D3]|uniref:hypothetical protein n=1 Tax=Actinomadura sp. B10D3 TaxID=3153557 RepID=UPI00325F0C24
MSNTLMKLRSSWIAACPGASISRVSEPGLSAHGAVYGSRLRDLRGTNWREQRFEQRIQDDLGRSVFEHLLEDMSVPAPATAHVGVTAKGGVSGPYPWRRPV